jgi:hypothetical protein
MFFNRRTLLGLTLATAVAGSLAAVCSKSDNGTNPVTPSDTTAFTQDFAEQAGVLAAETFGAVLSGVPEIAGGDIAGGFGGLGRMIPSAPALADTAVYDATRHAWVYSKSVGVAGGGDSTHTSVDIAAEFKTEGVEHEDRTSWDTIHALLDLDLFHHLHGTTTTDITSSHHFDFNITPNPTGPWSVLGDGYSDITVATSIPTSDILPRYTYHVDLTNVQRSACPDGTITVTMGAYQLIATYDHSSTVSWALHHPVGGAVVKTGEYSCDLGR